MQIPNQTCPAMLPARLAAHVHATPAWAFFTSLPGIWFLPIRMSKQNDDAPMGFVA